MERRENFSFYEDSIILIPNSDEETNIHHEHRPTILKKIIGPSNLAICNKTLHLSRTHKRNARLVQRSNINQRWQAHLMARSWFVISFSNKRNQGSLSKWLILGLWYGMYKMNLEHLAQCQKVKQCPNLTKCIHIYKHTQGRPRHECSFSLPMFNIVFEILAVY